MYTSDEAGRSYHERDQPVVFEEGGHLDARTAAAQEHTVGGRFALLHPYAVDVVFLQLACQVLREEVDKACCLRGFCARVERH